MHAGDVATRASTSDQVVGGKSVAIGNAWYSTCEKQDLAVFWMKQRRLCYCTSPGSKKLRALRLREVGQARGQRSRIHSEHPGRSRRHMKDKKRMQDMLDEMWPGTVITIFTWSIQ
jgi:hypothetical protein